MTALNIFKQRLRKLSRQPFNILRHYRLSPSELKARQEARANLKNKALQKKLIQDKISKEEARQKSFIEFEESAADISKDFLRQRASGVSELYCERPWRRLEVKVRDNRTKVCCDFAMKLPEFKWPTLEEFHDEKHMWNHPYLQHMRRSMGMQNEVPYCTLCLTTNKRASNNKQLREEARKQTVDFYTAMEMDILSQTYRGRLDDFKDTLDEYVYSYGTTIREGIFNNSVFEYRNMVRLRGFAKTGDVLQIGGLGALSPFLSEANKSLTIADFFENKLSFTLNLLKDFGLESDARTLPTNGLLPFENESFDDIWLQGQMLYGANRAHFLKEIHRILRPNGRLFVRSAYGPGELVERILKDPSGNAGCDDNESIESENDLKHDDCLRTDYMKNLNAIKNSNVRINALRQDATLARDALLKGFAHNGLASFISSNRLRQILRRNGFNVDLAYPAAAFPHKKIHKDKLIQHLKTDEALSKAIRDVTGQRNIKEFDPCKLEGHINFSAIKNSAAD